MTALETLWCCKTPSEQELEAMKLLPSLRSLELAAMKLEWQEPCFLNGLSELTSLTFLWARFCLTSVITPVVWLTRLEKLKVVGGLASQTLLRKILTEFPRLKEVSWFVRHHHILDTAVPLVDDGNGCARSLIRLECSPIEGQACDPLQWLAFPVLQDLQAVKHMYMETLNSHEDLDDSLAWFPSMCRSAPSLTSLKLVPRGADNQQRVPNVRFGIPTLTNLKSLHLLLRTEADSLAERGFVGAQQLTGWTRLWVEGVVDPRSFDTEVIALSGLEALRE